MKKYKNPARLLSGGERRRVEIARSIAGQPKYILMDEPFSGVDPLAIEEIKNIIKSLSASNIGVLITTIMLEKRLVLLIEPTLYMKEIFWLVVPLMKYSIVKRLKEFI